MGNRYNDNLDLVTGFFFGGLIIVLVIIGLIISAI